MDQAINKRELNKARKREAIVEIATNAFFENGYAATSMSAISERLGGSKATLWAHFSSKEELFAAVVDGQVDAFSRDITETLTGKVFSQPAFRVAAIRFLDCLLRANSVQLFRMVVAEGERFPEINEMFYSRGPSKVRRCMHNFFETQFSEEESIRLTQVTMAAITGYRGDILLRPTKPTPFEREAFVDALIDSIVWPAPEQNARITTADPLSLPVSSV